jgi:2-dehydropantoate 2-reductase
VCDLVVIGLKTTANDQFPHLLPPLVGPQTAVLTLQNGLGNEEALARLFPTPQILGGLCFVCLNRIAPGVIQHLDHGLVVLGEFSGPVRERTHTILRAFETAGVPCRISDDLAKAHWEKLVWNIPFNGLGVAGAAGLEYWDTGEGFRPGPVLTTDVLLRDPRWESLVRALMLEVIHGAGGLGFRLEESLADQMIARTKSMGPYKASTLLDYEKGLPLELETLFLEPLRRAEATGVPMPLLRRLCEVLKSLARR